MTNHNRLLIVLIAVGVLAAFIAAWITSPERGPIARPDAAADAGLHQRLFTIDTHVDIPETWAGEGVDPGPDGRWQVDLQKMRDGGLDGAFFIVYVPQGPRDAAGNAEAAERALRKFAAIRRMTDRLYPDDIGLAVTADEARALDKAGKLAAFIGIENGSALGGRLELLEYYRDMGARYIGLVHNGHNDLADSAQPKPGEPEAEYGGLSAFGRDVVREANRLGVMVDVSHSTKAVTLEAARLTKAPIIASHSSVRALMDHPRNLDDESLKAIAKTGGVVQIVAFDAYLHDVPEEKGEAVRTIYKDFGFLEGSSAFDLSDAEFATLRARRDALDAQWPPADVVLFVDHIDYAVKLIGVDHVGIASDFGGGGGIAGWQDASQTKAVTDELVKRGYSEKDLAKIWGGNILRVMGAVERKASR